MIVKGVVPKFLHVLAAIQRVAWDHKHLIFFALACAMIYERSGASLRMEYEKLQNQYLDFKNKTAQAQKQQDRLVAQMNSQSDPAYLELVLMQKLGLVPEGYTKVYFEEPRER